MTAKILPVGISLGVCAAAAIAVAAYAAPAAPAVHAVTDAGARLIDQKGRSVGTALFHQTPKGVQIELSASGLVLGPHGVHIHAVGKCDPAGGFKTAGAHFDVGGHHHGKMDPQGPHTGDMDNQSANKLGFMRATITVPGFTLSPGPTSLLDADGSSIVIHMSADDYKSQPAGNSGDRVACGVIKPM